jgi:ABC-type multidrug transport system fused ATPase/permease subunit
VDWLLGYVSEPAERKIRQVRTQKVIEAFYKLEFALMTDENFNRFMRLSGNIIHYPTYFREPIDLICRAVEVCITAVIVGYNISRLSPLLGVFCVTLTSLNAVKVMCALPLSFGTYGLAIDHSKARENWKPKSIAERRAQHLQHLAFFDIETSQDIVLHGAEDWLTESFGTSSNRIPIKGWDNNKQHLQTMFAQTITVLETVGIPALSILLGQKISFESYHLVQQSLASICRNASTIQEFITRSVKDAVPYAEEYFECLEMGISCERLRASQEKVVGQIESLEVRDIYFRYPKQDLESHETLSEEKITSQENATAEIILKGISFNFRKGQVYSIVGKNGSGKSTLVKILTKLHSPSQGSVLVNGIDLKNLSASSWHKRLAVAPQEFSQMYDFTIRENIGLGQTSLLYDDSKGIIEREAKAGCITAFVDLETYVGSLSGSNKLPGTESETWKCNFSGGQWQSIALARTLCRTLCESVEVLIMDEPSSALDPIAEHRLFARLREERAQRITIFISHRLQTARASDCILVIDEGVLVQSGPHDELLLNPDGLYRRMYSLQNETLD